MADFSPGTRDILSHVPIVNDFVDSNAGILRKKLKEAELAAKLQEIQKNYEETQKKTRSEMPARFIFGQSPDQTKTAMDQIFQKDIPPNDLVSGNLDAITSGIDSAKQKIQADQNKFGNATLDEYKTFQQTERENDYTPKVATKEDEVATGGRIKAGTATTEGNIKLLAAMQRTQMMADSPARQGNQELANKKFLVEVLQHKKTEILKKPGYLRTDQDKQILDSLDKDINSISGVSEKAPALAATDAAAADWTPATPPPAAGGGATPPLVPLPEKALAAVRVADGKVVTFRNKQKWKWDGTQAVQVK